MPSNDVVNFSVLSSGIADHDMHIASADAASMKTKAARLNIFMAWIPHAPEDTVFSPEMMPECGSDVYANHDKQHERQGLVDRFGCFGEFLAWTGYVRPWNQPEDLHGKIARGIQDPAAEWKSRHQKIQQIVGQPRSALLPQWCASGLPGYRADPTPGPSYRDQQKQKDPYRFVPGEDIELGW